MIRVAPSFVRLAALAVAGLLSAGTLVACGSSSSAGGSPSSSPSASASTSVSTSVQAGGTTPNLTALCTGLNAADLSSLSQAKDPASMEQAWATLAADAPDAIKADVQTIDKYLKAAVAHDYTALAGVTSQLQDALTHLETYITTNCHA